jgi:hypothetical protein
MNDYGSYFMMAEYNRQRLRENLEIARNERLARQGLEPKENLRPAITRLASWLTAITNRRIKRVDTQPSELKLKRSA